MIEAKHGGPEAKIRQVTSPTREPARAQSALLPRGNSPTAAGSERRGFAHSASKPAARPAEAFSLAGAIATAPAIAAAPDIAAGATLLGAALAMADPIPFVWTATGLERQVFLDNSGRRGRRVRLAGGGTALLSAGWIAALVTGSLGFSSLPHLSLRIPPAGRPAARLVHVASADHDRTRTVASAALNATSAAAARTLAREEIDSPSGTLR